MKIKQTLRKRLRVSLLVALATSMTVTLSPMLLFLFNNQREFWFKPQDIVPFVAGLFAIVAVAVLVFLLVLPPSRKGRLYLAFSALAASVSLCYYIQSTYMISYLPVMTGDEINWGSYTFWGAASLVLWLGVPAAAAVLWIFRPKWLKAAVSGVCAVLLAMESITLGVTLLTQPPRSADVDAYFSDEGLHEVSANKNVVLIVSDTFEGTFMNDVLEQYPQWKDTLKDFTYYNNTTGVSCFTYFSFAKLMTDVDFPLGMSSDEGIAHAFRNQTLIDAVRGNGYDVAYYTYFKPTENISGKVLNYVDNVLRPNTEAKMRITKLLLKGTMLQGVPHQLKKHFVTLTKDFSDTQTLLPPQQKGAPYVENDFLYRKGLLSGGITAKEGKPRYVMYQLYGVHSPYEVSRDFEKVTFGDHVTTREKQIEAALAALKLLNEYMDELKAAGVYDNTTIIFTADHGFDMRFYPVLLVKETGARGDVLQMNNAPLSFQDDYAALLDSVTGGLTFAQAVDKLNLSDDRVRHAVDFRLEKGYGKENNMRSVVEIKGPAYDPASYQVVQEEYDLDENFAGRYTLGKSLTEAQAAGEIAVHGLRGDKTLYGHSMVLDVHLAEKPEKGLWFSLDVTNVSDVEQPVTLMADGQPVASWTLQSGESLPLEAQLPAKVCEDQRVILSLEAPRAVLQPGTSETLGTNEYVSLTVGEGAITLP